MNARLSLLTCFLFTALWALPSGAAPTEKWNHPDSARAQIHRRIAHQEYRIEMKRRAGTLTEAQAQALFARDRAVLMQEHADAASNRRHGHLHKRQMHALNRELNAVSRAIGD